MDVAFRDSGHVLPRFMVIADRFTVPANFKRVLELAKAGVLPWVQLRDHDAPPDRFESRARQLVARIGAAGPGTRISLNGAPALSKELGVGVHLGFRSMAPADAAAVIPSDTCLGYSAHADVEISVIAHCDYVTVSPVFPVQKPTASVPLGLNGLAHMTTGWPGRVFALGGIRPETVSACLKVGAYGICVLSGVMKARDPVAAAKSYLDGIREWVGSNE